MFKTLISVAIISASLLYQPLSLAENTIDAGRSHALFSEAMSDMLGIHGKQKSSEKAFKKFEKLAQQGWKTAQHMLGNMYAKGEGTTKNNVQAYVWYSLAAQQNFSIAEQKLDSLRPQLKQAQLNKANTLVENWKTR